MKNTLLPHMRLLQLLRWGLGWGLCWGLLGVVVMSCRGSVVPPPPDPISPASFPSTETPSSSPTPSPSTAIDAPATIRAIVAQPVWVRPAQGDESAAQVGTPLQYDDTIRTEDPALAEVSLGEIVFRLGGNASLTLRPNQQLQMATGQMLTWLEGSPPGPVTIQTPIGAAGIRGTTVFVNIDENPQEPIEFFAWEGEVTFQPTGATDVVVIRDGEQLLVRPGEVDVTELQRRVRRFGPEEFRQRLEESALVNGFSQPLPTLSQIEAVGEALETER